MQKWFLNALIFGCLIHAGAPQSVAVETTVSFAEHVSHCAIRKRINIGSVTATLILSAGFEYILRPHLVEQTLGSSAAFLGSAIVVLGFLYCAEGYDSYRRLRLVAKVRELEALSNQLRTKIREYHRNDTTTPVSYEKWALSSAADPFWEEFLGTSSGKKWHRHLAAVAADLRGRTRTISRLPADVRAHIRSWDSLCNAFLANSAGH